MFPFFSLARPPHAETSIKKKGISTTKQKLAVRMEKFLLASCMFATFEQHKMRKLLSQSEAKHHEWNERLLVKKDFHP